MARRVVILGGPKHGVAVNIDGGDNLCWPVVDPNFSYKDPIGGVYPEFKTISCPIVNVSVGTRVVASAAVYPDIKRDTGLMLLADYVEAAWNTYDITHRGRR